MSWDDACGRWGLAPAPEPLDTYDVEAPSLYEEAYGSFDEDRSFWTETVSALAPAGSVVIELGCGAGRITRWIGQDPALRLVCVDHSLNMLQGMSPVFTGDVAVVAADVAAMPLRDSLADLVIAPFSVLNYLTTYPLIRSAFDEAARVTRVGGSVVIDLAYHDLAALSPDTQRSLPRVDHCAVPPAVIWWDWRVTTVWNSADYHEYQVHPDGGKLKVVELVHRWHLYTITELLLLLALAHLEPVEFYGDYHRSPFTASSDRLIVRAVKSSQEAAA